MESFLALPEDKRDVITAAAMSLFGVVGYKKASVADIAAASGVAKATIFYYFGSKKALYMYLADFAGKVIKEEVNRRFDKTVTDFFDKIRLASEIKLAALKKYPGILSFLTSMYYETDREVYGDIKRIVAEGEAYGAAFVFDNLDTHKFKEGVDPALVLQILTYYSEGYMSKAVTGREADFDALMADFNRCMTLMKTHFYKDEFVEKGDRNI